MTVQIQLKRYDYRNIITHSIGKLPNEACGLIAGTIEATPNGIIKKVEQVYLLSNPEQSPEKYSIDPKEQLAAVKDMRANNLAPLGNFHSHPATPARPSEEDIKQAHDPKASYLILSLAKEPPVLKAFEISNTAISEQKVEIV